MNIWAVCKDPGGTNGVLPVVKALQAMGHNVLVIVNGKAVELLKDKEEYVVYDDAARLLADYPLPEAVITSMCSKGGVGRDLVPLLKGRVPVVALQDFWGGALWAEWAEVRPDYITTNDEVGKKIIQDAWPDFSPDHIKVTGFPALDKYKTVDVRAVTERVRVTLGLSENKPIILVGGQADFSGPMLKEVVSCLNTIGQDVYLIPRAHPRMKNDWPQEQLGWENAMREFNSGTLLADTSVCDTPSLIACSSFVISMFSTIQIEAAVLRKPNISVWYPEIERIWYQSTNEKMGDFPLVRLGCAAKAENREVLCELLRQALNGDLDLRVKQEQNFRLDGKNAERVAQFISTLTRSL